MKLLNILLEAIMGQDVYFDSYSSAVQFARLQAEKRGYEIDEDSWFREVNVGPRKPQPSKTNRMSIILLKNGKEQRKLLHIQVYNRGTNSNPYELNYYIQ